MSDTLKNSQTRYDASQKTLWVYRKFDDAKTLLPGAELQGWVKQLQSGKSSDGEPISHINIVFSEQQTAAYNHQPLTYSKLGVYYGDLDSATRYHSEEGDPDFDTRSDFGID